MPLTRRRAIIMSLLSATPVLAADAPRKPRPVLAATPIARTDLRWWKARHEAKLAELRARKPALVFYGDSITQQYEYHGPPDWKDYIPIWQRFYGNRNAVNLGFTGDTTASLLWRIQNGQASDISPKVAVVLIGANNLGRLHWSAEDTVQGIERIVQELRRRLPTTRILLLGVLPSDRSVWATETTIAINRSLSAKYGRSPDATYLDVGPVLMRGGRPNHDLFYDPKLTPPATALHPTAQGMAMIAEAMEPTLSTLMR